MARGQISQGKTRDLRPNPSHIHAVVPDDIGLENQRFLAHFHVPRMRFVYLDSGLCLQLPSDSTSRWTPLLFG
jgi:hypothetical protein